MIVHIHLPDDNAEYTQGVLIDLINAGYKMSVPEPDPDATDLSVLLEQAIDRAVAAADPEQILDDQADAYVDDMPDWDIWEMKERAWKLKAQRIEDATKARTVGCPKCHVGVGDQCVSMSGKTTHREYAHVGRIQLANKPAVLVRADKRAKASWTPRAITLDEM
jgi:hypothetical protein